MGLVAVALLGTLGAQLTLIHQQRDLAVQQRHLAITQLHTIAPLADAATPLARKTLQGLPAIRMAERRADALTRAATPLVAGLTAAGLPATVAEVLRALAALRGADAGAVVRSLGEVTAGLTAHARLTRLVRSAITVLGSVRSSGLVARLARAVPRLDRAQGQALTILRRTLALQREAVGLNRRNLATAEATLAVARQTLSHAASLDEKLAGPLLGTGRSSRP